MDDQHIEEMLRQSWSPEPPQRLRDKVLQQPAQRRISSRWKLALVGVGLAIVVLANVADHARHSRMSALLDGRNNELARPHNLCDLKIRSQMMFDDDLLYRKKGG